ncbi:MFS transporter [Psychrobacillus sp. L3]|uniref:MFS transporter n=1 Tax=Psychrobacillus sp. L3 TaxID=3236891 RepID=UPI0036F3B9A5
MTSQLKRLNFSICFMLIFATMNSTMMNIALPKFAEEFILTPTEVSWVTSIFSLMFGIGAVIFGKLADIYPIRRLLVIGIIIFMIGSLIGFFSSNFGLVILARIIQGFGAAALPALSMVMGPRFYPPAFRGKVLAMVFSMVALGAAAGPILGGFLTDWFGLEALFAINFLTLLGLPIFLKYAPKEETKTGTFNILGAIIFTLAITSILMGINVSSWLLLAAAVLLFIFYLQSKRTADPFIEIKIFKNRSFSLVLLMSFLNTITYMGTLFILPLMLSKANGLSANWIGLVLFPGALLTAILGPQVGRLIQIRGSRFINQWAFVLMAVACLGLSTIVGFSPIWISLMAIFIFLGFTANQTAFSNYISQILPPNQIGIGLGLFTLMTFLASAIGISLYGRFLGLKSGHWNILNSSSYNSYSNALLLAAIVILLGMIVLTLEKTVKKREAL